jgi:iron complex transport system permease protein
MIDNVITSKSRSSQHRWLWLVVLILPCLLFVLELSAGSISLPLRDVWLILIGEEPSKPHWTFIVLELRLPRALTAFGAGASLGIAGLLMQTLFQNVLAGPYVMGISSGASLGVALVLLGSSWFGWQTEGALPTTMAASLGAAVMMTGIVFFAKLIPGQVGLLLVGLMAGYAVGALVQLLMFFSTAESLQNFTLWSMGHYGKHPMEDLGVPALLLGCAMMISLLISRPLDLILQGTDTARHLGVPVKPLRILVLLCAGLLSGTVTAMCGPIAFLGLAIPHLCRRLFKTSEHRVLIVACIFMGGSLSMLADWIAQCPGSDQSLPLNAITSIIGAPIVMFVMFQQRRSGMAD